MAAPRAQRAVAAGVFLVAAAYFALGATLGLEWTDEGQIVYPSWLVAHGALPYRDFRHGYGPSVFLWNGALLRLFGDDLLVIRAGLVLLKAAVAVLVWSLARRVTSTGYALAAAALLVALWGGPWWIFNAPYANHYGIALGLVGLLAFLALRPRLLLACALAGLGCGAAATFKQTNGVFSFVPLALFLLCEPYLLGGAPPAAPVPGWTVPALVALRVAALAGSLLLFVAYAAAADAWTFVVLLTPAAVTLAALGARVWRDPVAGDPPRTLAAVAAAGLGFAAPLLAYAALYGAQGLLGELLFNVSDLVRLLRWFDPLPRPPLRAALMAALVLLAAVALRRAHAAHAAGALRQALAGLAVGVAAPLAVVLLAATWGGSEWYLDAFRVLFMAPFAVTALSTVWLLRPQAPFWNPPGPGGRRAALALLHLNAAASLLYMYPAGDFWHLAMIWPAFLPLLAYQLQCVGGAPSGARAIGWAARGLVAFIVLGLGLPQVAALVSARRQYPAADAAPFARASRITGTTPKFADAALLVRRLDELAPPAEPVLIVSNEQLLYFLSGRSSPVAADEFALYLVGAGLIDTADAHRLLPEERLVEALRRSRARVIEVGGSPMVERFYRTYPAVASLVASQYDLEATAGAYRILRWRQ